jgi:hypothetical protein
MSGERPVERLKQLFGFLRFGYEPDSSTVVVTLRLNAYFVQGATVAAVLLTLIFRYGEVSVGSAFRLAGDLVGLWPLLTLLVVALLVVVAMKGRSGPEEGLRSKVSALLPKGIRGTALLCLVLLGLLVFVMWGASGETPPEGTTGGPSEHRERPAEWRSPPGEETPRLFRELQEGRRTD